MNIIFFTHPSFQSHQSMPRFAKMLADGMSKRGHTVSVWSPQERMRKLLSPTFLKKWLGYIDQYIIFPLEVKSKIKKIPKDTLFVFTDHALGPWVPIVKDLPHVIHCHDFLAQQSALNEIPENPLSWSGKKYQAYIRNGYTSGKNFISVSKKTQTDLNRFLNNKTHHSDMVYNGLNQVFTVQDPNACRLKLSEKITVDLHKGYLLHVGGNQWYKNRLGVVAIYDAWRELQDTKLPLLLIGNAPDVKLLAAIQNSTFKNDIHILTGLNDEYVRWAYCGASVFLFPSLAEGFGWPIAEAMASGCPIITTNQAPMTEVAGNAAFLIPRKTQQAADSIIWAQEAAKMVDHIIRLSSQQRNEIIELGLENIKRFDSNNALDQIEEIYVNILA